MKRGGVCDRVETPVGKENEGRDRSVGIWRSKFGGYSGVGSVRSSPGVGAADGAG